ncbi:exo-beta-N-acetylmuramidase NamZ domain-containing protein [Arcticibacter sp. MXS-1]|uniref:exo-beta-N-acetylmuramidase NamZ family protein n=1 Tax=Arcticibacter sp. MXS-1 TaxID=3341726 RepID=UPI0035A8ED73
MDTRISTRNQNILPTLRHAFHPQAKTFFVLLLLILIQVTAFAQNPADKESDTKPIMTGAQQTEKYFPYLKGKKVGMVVNQTSVIGSTHTIDSLRKRKINIVKIFGPEHGFRGQASAGVKVQSDVDAETGIPVISLYGGHNKPTPEDLKGIDLLIFDIQDVGARFYTYISTLHYVMEACAENDVELLILDRPNPNGFYVDGPVLEKQFQSFIGMHPIPIVHGMTIAEYAGMINGEGWLKNNVKCKLKVIEMLNYSHETPYNLPVKPSPNLNTQQSILLYPSLCLFEGTIISQGRGTHFPFQVLGSPQLVGKYSFMFTPKSIKGMSETPLHMNLPCYGLDLRSYDTDLFRKTGKLNLQWLIELYNAYPEKEKLFDFKQSKQIGNFDKLAGTASLRKQIIEGKTEEEIRKSWEPALSEYKSMRKKYLLYE